MFSDLISQIQLDWSEIVRLITKIVAIQLICKSENLPIISVLIADIKMNTFKVLSLLIIMD